MKPSDKLALKKYRYYQKLNAKLKNDDEDIDYSDVHKYKIRVTRLSDFLSPVSIQILPDLVTKFTNL